MQSAKSITKHLSMTKEEKRILDISLPFSADVSLLDNSLQLKHKTIENRVVFQPMEGCDGEPDGNPGELTLRRYERFAGGGAGLIWIEAVSVTEEGRANPRQLMLNSQTEESFKTMADKIKRLCFFENGFEPVLIMQLTHSGRYAKRGGSPAPIVAHSNRLLEGENCVSDDRIASDDYLKRLEEAFGQAAVAAQRAGFDGVDIKCCHGYLLNEFLSAYDRPGIYGGSFENRTRLLLNSIAAACSHTDKEFIVTSRLTAYDGFEYPFGFGVNQNDGLTPDYTELIKLVDILHQKHGLEILNITAGNPYVNPHVNRPSGTHDNIRLEDPFLGVKRILGCAEIVQKGFPELNVVASGLTYLKQSSVNVAAGLIQNESAKLVGFGRQAFAYPRFYRDLKVSGKISAEKCCVACGKCSEMMRMGTVSGCVVRDSEVYAPLYMEKRKAKISS